MKGLLLLMGMFCVGLMLLSPGQALAAEAVFAPAPGMVADASNASASQAAKVLRARVVTVNTAMLFPDTKGDATPDAAAALTFNLFDNMTVQVTPRGGKPPAMETRRSLWGGMMPPWAGNPALPTPAACCTA